jgi:hypothetical protein
MTRRYQIVIANCCIHNFNVTTSINVLKAISEKGKAYDWYLKDEYAYETLDRDITAVMLRAVEMCSI